MGATAKMVRDAAEKSPLLRVSTDRSAIAPLELPFDREDTSQGRCTRVCQSFPASCEELGREVCASVLIEC